MSVITDLIYCFKNTGNAEKDTGVEKVVHAGIAGTYAARSTVATINNIDTVLPENGTAARNALRGFANKIAESKVAPVINTVGNLAKGASAINAVAKVVDAKNKPKEAGIQAVAYGTMTGAEKLSAVPIANLASKVAKCVPGAKGKVAALVVAGVAEAVVSGAGWLAGEKTSRAVLA